MQIKLSDHFTYKKLLRFTLPSVMMMIFTSIYGVVDGFFISNYVGAIPFAAVNLIMPFLMLLATVGFMFGTGGSALVAMLLGRGEKERANGIFSFLVYVLAAVGIIFTVLGFVFLPEVSRMLGASEEMLPYCVMYGRIVLFSLTLFMLQISFQDYLVVAERPKLGFYTTLAAGCTNMLLDAFLVGYLSMGVTGAALATCISETVGGLIPLVYFVMPNGGTLRLGKPYAAFKPLLRAASNGVSEFVSSVSMSFVSILYNFQLIAIAGENGVAAYGIIMYVDFLFMALFIGYSMGISPVISYHYGAQNHMEVRSVLRKSLFVIGASGVIITVLAETLAYPMAIIFVSYDIYLLELTAHGFRLYSFAFLLCGFNIFGSAFFTALNNGMTSAVVACGRTLLCESSAVLLLPMLLGSDGIWLAIVLAEIMALALTGYFFMKNRARYGYAWWEAE